jgi:hypothetical protein
MNRLRVGFALAGFALSLLSVTLDNARLGWAAIALLLCSLILRLILRKQNGVNSRTEP